MIALFLVAALSAAPLEAPAASSAPVSTACSQSAYRQFDFWVGDWTAFHAGGGDVVAQVKVARVADGCGLIEQVTPAKGAPSEALILFDPAATLWRRESVAGDGQVVSLQGGMQNDAMVLEGEEAGSSAHGLVRVTWKVQGEVVSESAERSPDGRDWSSWYDLELRRTR